MKKQHGGARPGAGRKPILKDPVRKNVTLEARHVKKLEKYAKAHNLTSDSECVRRMIDSQVP